jgi:DNA-binding NarL/FixJ family response regulator
MLREADRWRRATGHEPQRGRPWIYVELERIMAMPLTQDEQIVLRHLISGESSEEIAATLDWPLQVVRNCTHTLITWVLDGLEERGRTPTEYLPAPPPVA